MRRIKKNPELLIINPGRDSKRSAWRKLRQTYPIAKAVEYYEQLYPMSARTVKRNIGEVDFKDNPEYLKAVALFKRFHGKDPAKITRIEIPELGDSKKPLFFVTLGEAVAENYLTANIIKGSSKGDSVYVHKYESPEGRLPLKAVSSDGRLIITVPGKHKVSDWIRG
jgi:hypothetical protein